MISSVVSLFKPIDFAIPLVNDWCDEFRFFSFVANDVESTTIIFGQLYAFGVRTLKGQIEVASAEANITITIEIFAKFNFLGLDVTPIGLIPVDDAIVIFRTSQSVCPSYCCLIAMT